MGFSLLMNGLFWIGGFMARADRPAFGFQVRALDLPGSPRDNLAWPNEKNLRQAPNLQAGRRITWQADFYLRRAHPVLWHLSGSGKIVLKVNGKTWQPQEGLVFSLSGLKKGKNRILIQWTRPENSNEIGFVFKGSLYDKDFPFYHWQIPGNDFSRFFSLFLTAVAPWKNLGFYIALCLCFIPLFRKSQPFRQNRNAGENQFRSMPVLSLFFASLSLFSLLNFYNQFIPLRLPILLLSVSGTLFFSACFMIRSFFGKTAGSAETRSKQRFQFAAFFLAAVLITLVSGKTIQQNWIPQAVSKGTDLAAHLEMTASIQDKGEFQAGLFAVYPQSFHALLALLSGMFSLPAGKIIVPVLFFFFVLFIFVQCLMARYIFPGLSWYWFPAAFSLLLPGYFYATMFGQFSFPAIVAVSIFIWSILEAAGRRRLLAGLNLLAAASVYPVFAPPFALIFLLVTLLAPFPRIISLREIIALGLLGFSTFLFYLLFYLKEDQHHQAGYSSMYQVDVFSFMGFLAAVVLLIGLRAAVNREGPIAIWALAPIVSFAAFYLPQLLYSLFSHYYLWKNLTFLIPFLLPFFAFGLSRLYAQTWKFLKIHFIPGKQAG